jgi:hypothetical protein
MASEFWFLDREGAQQGPVGTEEFASLIRSGVIVRSTEIWHAGMADWQAAGQVDGLASFFVPSPPQPPPRRKPEGQTARTVSNNAQKAPQVVQAEYGIPHVNFRRNDDGGFTVTFRRPSVVYYMGAAIVFLMILCAIVIDARSGSVSVGTVLVAISVAYLALPFIRRPTTITVTPELIVINGKSLARSDFGSFQIFSAKRRGHILGYTYGRRAFPVGGGWTSARRVQEVASALNHELTAAPLAGTEQHASPAALRAARPTEF